MFYLIKKDWLVHHWGAYFLCIGWLLFITITTLPPMFAAFVCLLAICFSLFTYDERKHVAIFLRSMPVSSGEVVKSRYIFSIVVSLLICLFLWGMQALFAPASIMPFSYGWQDFYVFFMLLCIFIALIFPLMYGIKNTNIAMMLLLVLIIISTYFTLDLLVKELGMTNDIVFNHIDLGFALYAERIFPFAPFLMITAVTVVLLFISIYLSIALYNRKFC